MNWALKKFDELNIYELYSILQLRNEVFIIEQYCVYPDLDNKDQSAWHLMCHADNKLIAYTRLMPPGENYAYPSIGRVVTSPVARKSGLGRALMQRSISASYELFGNTTLQLSAQVYLQKFYESLGFIPTSEVYLEDGIEHIEMTREAAK